MKVRHFLYIFVGILLASCNNYLDITPDGQEKRDEMLQTQEGLESALYGAYASMRDASLYGREMTISALEIMAQNVDCYGSESVEALNEYNYKYSDVEDLFESTWTKMYKNISNVNSVLNSPLIEQAKEYPYTLYRGEALGLRGFMHFDLVRLFCEQYTQNPSASGIPYATEFSLNTPDFETLEKNYQHILSDLLQADSLLSSCQTELKADDGYFAKDQQIHMNLWAVRATLARVYLTMGNREMAVKYAKQVIAESGYTLKEKTEVEGDVAGVLSQKECIFGIYYADFYDVVSATLQKTTSYYSLDPRDDIESLYEKDADGMDYRSNAYLTSVDVGGTPTLRLSKFTDPYELQNISSSRPSSLILGINLIRLPEMYYIVAECELESNYTEALQYFDAVVQHRGLSAVETRAEGNTLTMDMLNTEREKEYLGEGQIFFSRKRQNLSFLSTDGKTTIQPSTSIYVVPIPEIEYENRY